MGEQINQREEKCHGSWPLRTLNIHKIRWIIKKLDHVLYKYPM